MGNATGAFTRREITWLGGSQDGSRMRSRNSHRGSPPVESVDEERMLDLAMDDRTPPDDPETAAENQAMLRRQSDFRTAAEYVARAFSTFEEVQRVVLFGSVALPLEKEVPWFRRLRQAGIAIWHECSDVDLAVWV